MAGSKYLTAPPATPEMPRGIPYIVGNEAAERFSFYGMKAILAVFMTKYLMGLDGQRDVMSEEEARTYVHLFVASAYFFPILGALLSDWLLGKYRTIISLSIVYCLGHLALALDETRIGLTVGLTLIAIGSGGIKPCVSAHVGDQFGALNQHRLSRVFGWFYFSINLGAFASTLLTPVLLQQVGPSVAFGVPGALMFLATWVFWLGRHKFVHVPPGGTEFVKESFSGDGLAAIRNLVPIYLLVTMFWALFDQTASAWVLQAEYMDRHWLGVEWLSSQIQAVNPILILLFIPLFSYVIYPAIHSVFPLTPLRKIAIGFFVTVPAFAVPAWIESEITGGRVVPKFKPSPEAEFQSTSTADAERWSVRNLLDGQTDGSGWISARVPESPGERQSFFPQDIVIQLRERKAWTISSIQIHPDTDLKRFLQEVDSGRNDDVPTEEDVRRCWAKEVELLVGSSRIGPWKSLGRLTLAQTPDPQPFTFSPVEAGYVMVRIHSHWGGDYVCLGEVEVLASETLPADAHPYAAAVWPNVAATGYRPSIVWQLLAYAILTAAEIMVSITCLEFSYTQAPRKMKSFIMSLYLLSISAGNAFTSVVNQVIQNPDGSSKLEGADYYWFFTAVMLGAALLFILVAKMYRGRTYIQGEEPASAEP